MATEIKTPEQIKQEQHGKLMKKLSEVIRLTGNVEKKGTNKEQGYKFATHSDIINEIRKHVAEQGIFILPKPDTFNAVEVITGGGKKGTLLTITIDFEIIDTETGYSIIVKWFGQGLDFGDKALYKSYTGALKYFLLDTFMISTGDDPEKESPEGNGTIAKPVFTPKPIQSNQKQKIEDLLKEKGKTRDDLDKYLVAAFKTSFEKLNTAQANMAIKKLEAMPKKEEEINNDEVAAAIEKDKLANPEKPNGAVGYSTEPK